MPTTSLRILNLADVARQTGYSRTRLWQDIGADLADGTPGRRFPAPLRDPLGRPPGKGRRVEWAYSDVHGWIESRRAR